MTFPQMYPDPWAYPDENTFPDHKERIKYIEDRYGEDIADAIDYAVRLYFQPDALDLTEDQDRDGWSLHNFRMAAATDPMRSIRQISEQANKGMELLVEYAKIFASNGRAHELAVNDSALGPIYQCFNEIDSMTVEDSE